MRITANEWAVMEALWAGGSYSLGELAAAVDEGLGWSKNTLATYLKRMAAKGLVKIDRGAPKPYSAAVERDDCARAEREALLNRVYNGAAGELIAAFLTESRISRSEAERLRRLLDEMEV
ncbi:MAG TPA: BlaI/MecI/CopY family transcriptional regulator [Candidatus Scatomorpha stercoravium]|nr:BlaI/MecI/CopY family transcriptional regulator [Candidatus Scatomorpha stercoravium]